MASGVSTAYKKDGTVYYRASITYKNKHISLGSSASEKTAARIYSDAASILNSNSSHWIDPELKQTSYSSDCAISFAKYITLINFRDNGFYIKTPVYMCKQYFLYFLNEDIVLEFSADDLFYYSIHTLQCRGGHYFVSDYGMQTNILSRFGIHSHSVKGRDYIFKNGDEHDFRYENIQVINQYNGVTRIEKNGRIMYQSKIHINGDYILGVFADEARAAIAYNKAIDCLSGLTSTEYTSNYIESVSPREYASIYTDIKLSRNFREYIKSLL